MRFPFRFRAPLLLALLVTFATPLAAQDSDDREVQLRRAVRTDDVETVRRLLAEGVDPNLLIRSNKHRVYWMGLLGTAIDRGQEEIALLLIDAGADTAKSGGRNAPPLKKAGQAELGAVARRLVEVGERIPLCKESRATEVLVAAEAWKALAWSFRVPREYLDDHECTNLLYWVLPYADPELVSEMARLGADVNAVREFRDRESFETLGDYAPLEFVLAHGDRPDVARALVEAGADANLRNERDQPMLTALILGRDPELARETAKALLDFGADPAALDREGCPPLVHACRKVDLPLIETLIAGGTDPDLLTPACEDPTCFEALLANGASIVDLRRFFAAGGSPDGGTGSPGQPIVAAVKRRSRNVFDLLRELGAPVDVASPSGVTPLMMAASRQNLELLRELHGLGLDPTARDGQGRTALHYAAGSSPETDPPEVLQALLDLGVPADPPDDSGTTPLLLAAEARSISAVRVLLAAGASPNARDSEGNVPLVLARGKSSEDLRTLLLGAGADPNLADGRGRTLLHILARGAATRAVGELLAAGANPNARDEDGMTPLMAAALSLHLRTLGVLLEAGGDPKLKNEAGQTAGDVFWQEMERYSGGHQSVEDRSLGLEYQLPGPFSGRRVDLVEGSGRVFSLQHEYLIDEVHVVVARMDDRSELWRALVRASGTTVDEESVAPVSLALSDSYSELAPTGNLIRGELLRSGNPFVSYTAEVSSGLGGVVFVTASGSPRAELVTRALVESVLRSLKTSSGERLAAPISAGDDPPAAGGEAGGQPSSTGRLLLWIAVGLAVIGVAVWIVVARARSKPRFSVPDSYRPRPPG